MTRPNVAEGQAKKLATIMRPAISSAAMALSKMVGERIEQGEYIVKTTDSGDLASTLPNHLRKEICAVLLSCDGDIGLEVLFFLTSSDAEKLASRLVGARGRGSDRLRTSAITEACNIMTGSLLNSLAELSNLRVRASIPGYALDEMPVLLESPIVVLAGRSDETSLIQEELILEETGSRVHLWIMLDGRGVRSLIAGAKVRGR